MQCFRFRDQPQFPTAVSATATFGTLLGLTALFSKSELIRRGKNYELSISWKNGFPVVNVPESFGVLSAERVKQLLDDE